MANFKFKDAVQGQLGESIQDNIPTNADIVFVIDGTESMTPLIDTVKKMAIDFYEKFKADLLLKQRAVNQTRVKVIVFRDYYCDGPYAMEESDYFFLPNEEEEFAEYVNKIEAKGGGDLPENGLEALALAMRSDWIKEGQKKRHVIVLFTDAPAHPLEKAKGLDIPAYPKGMVGSLRELTEAWNLGSQGTCLDDETDTFVNKMDRRAKRLILYAPDAEPWTEIGEDFECAVHSEVTPDQGANELDKEIIMHQLRESCK